MKYTREPPPESGMRLIKRIYILALILSLPQCHDGIITIFLMSVIYFVVLAGILNIMESFTK